MSQLPTLLCFIITTSFYFFLKVRKLGNLSLEQGSQIFLAQDILMHLKLIKCLKEFPFLWVISSRVLESACNSTGEFNNQDETNP